MDQALSRNYENLKYNVRIFLGFIELDVVAKNRH
jgi:hypothetical protein